MDARLRQLAREFQSNQDPTSAQILIQGLLRTGQIPPPVLELLQMIECQTPTGPGCGFPSLYFVCGVNDGEGDPLEAARIHWLRNTFAEHRYLWFIISRNLLDFAAQRVLQPELQRHFEIVMEYNPPHLGPLRGRAQAWDKNYPGHYKNDGPKEYQLFRSQVLAALELLKGLGPQKAYLSSAVLNEQIIIWERWSALTCEEGYLSAEDTISPGVYAAHTDNWEMFVNLQGTIYNLVETLHHIFLALAGRTGVAHQDRSSHRISRGQAATPGATGDYTGSPFLKHWARDHGSLNPGHHLNFGNITRLNELVQNNHIDWFVVYSNCLVGCYFTYIWSLKAKGLDPAPKVSLEELEKLYDATEDQYGALLNQYRNAHPQYSKLIKKAAGKLSSAQRTRIENQLATIEEQILNTHADVQELDQRLVQLGGQMEEARERSYMEQEAVFERQFWQDTQPVFYVSIAEYLSS